MKTQRKQTKPTETRPRRVRLAPAGMEEVTALACNYLRTVTSGSYDDDGSASDLPGFHFFGLN